MIRRILIWVLGSILIFTNCAPKTSLQYSDKASRKLNRLQRGPEIDSLLFKAIELDSTNQVAYLCLASNVDINYNRKAYFEIQRNYFKKAINLDSTISIYWVYYAQTYNALAIGKLLNGRDTLYTDNIKKAIDAYSRAIELKSDDLQSLLERGRLYGLLQEYQLALKDYSKAANMGDLGAKNMVKYITGEK